MNQELSFDSSINKTTASPTIYTPIPRTARLTTDNTFVSECTTLDAEDPDFKDVLSLYEHIKALAPESASQFNVYLD
jgi:hypothetical protein